MTKPIQKDDPKRTSRDTPSREIQTSFEDHPEAGSMMKAASAIARIAANRKAIDFLYSQQEEQVEIARANGVTWEKIGNALGITRSAAQQYYGR